LLEGMRTTQAAPIGYAWLRSAALSLFGLGRGDEFREVAASIGKRTPWLAAATAIASGDLLEAAAAYAAIGALPDEGYTRLADAEALVDSGRVREAEPEGVRALAFFRSAGATALTARAAARAAASALPDVLAT